MPASEYLYPSESESESESERERESKSESESERQRVVSSKGFRFRVSPWTAPYYSPLSLLFPPVQGYLAHKKQRPPRTLQQD